MGKAIGRWHPAFWAKRAEEHKQELMANSHMMVGFEPSLARVALMEVKMARGNSNKNYWDRKRLKSALQAIVGGRLSKPYTVKIEKRMWCVYIGNDVFVLWERYVMAAATLEALRFHYAKHLMAHDTPAAGYV